MLEHPCTQSDLDQQFSITQPLFKYRATTTLILGGVPSISLENNRLLSAPSCKDVAVQKVKAGIGLAVDEPSEEGRGAVIQRGAPWHPFGGGLRALSRYRMPARPITVLTFRNPLVSSGVEPVQFPGSDRCVVISGVAHCVGARPFLVLLGC